ncbi:GlxA family transcriptional regulator [Ensifer sp.]|uniref:GlxA family transcriptional regulator n=1 Tax=Ensifer sp. TaxID=1872086 RepID=UPI0013AF45F1|nr:GlxA family transcriptional regulator [Ensifer sp.]
MQHAKTQGRRIIFYLLDGYAQHGFAAALEPLRLANDILRRPYYSWRILTRDGEPARTSCGLRMVAEGGLTSELHGLHQPDPPDMIVVCGGSAIPAADAKAEGWLRLSRRARVPVAALAGGLYSLARAGLLEGRQCAVHWEHFPDFSERFLTVNARQTAFEIDRDVYTCAGGSAPFDMVLRIVEDDLGPDVSNRICELALSERVRTAGDRQRLPLQTRVGIDNRQLIDIIERMEENLDEPLKLADLTPSTGLSRRQVERLFKRELGRSPKRYYLQMRLERAHLLLVNASLPIFEIAVACGFSSASHFSRTYRESYGCTPQHTRLQAREQSRSARPSQAPDRQFPDTKVA